jgi:hypothetical protein
MASNRVGRVVVGFSSVVVVVEVTGWVLGTTVAASVVDTTGDVAGLWVVS